MTHSLLLILALKCLKWLNSVFTTAEETETKAKKKTKTEIKGYKNRIIELKKRRMWRPKSSFFLLFRALIFFSLLFSSLSGSAEIGSDGLRNGKSAGCIWQPQNATLFILECTIILDHDHGQGIVSLNE